MCGKVSVIVVCYHDVKNKPGIMLRTMRTRHFTACRFMQGFFLTKCIGFYRLVLYFAGNLS